MLNRKILLLALIAVDAGGGAHRAAMADDALAAGFQSPPSAAKPRVWWHWMNGNVTKEGIELDFEWMKRVGIGGVQNFEAGFEEWGPIFDIPRLVETPLTYLSPEWRALMRDTVDLANELDLEFTIASSPGFSETGGPWVEPRQGMKKLVWSETVVTGGKPFKGRLARPPVASGQFQDIPLVDVGPHGKDPAKHPTYYADAATIAYRAPASEGSFASLKPTVTSSAGTIDAARLWDGDLADNQSLPFGADGAAWIRIEFPRPQRIRGVTAVIGGPVMGVSPLLELRERAWLEASDDGQSFRKVAELPRSGAPQQTLSFAPVVARVFRVVLERPAPNPFEQIGIGTAPVAHAIAEFALQTAARINRFEDKAGFSSRQIVDEDDTAPIASNDVIRKNDIVDLTQRMRPDGSLDWTPPAGRWIVLRLGYSLIARTNHPAARVATGLEVDKLNREHVRTYMDAYLGEYEKALGADRIGSRGLRYVLTDSYEVGVQNWTDDMLQQFEQRRGYDARLWLPVLAGRVVESAAASDRFLWDFRKTLADLIATAHYGQVSASLHARGLGRYGEAHETGRAFVGDGMEVKKTADVPMGAMWASRMPGITQEGYDADIRESASVAHVYGKNLVAAESLTALGNTFGFAPQDLKPIADRMLAMGLNRFVIHASVHQPDKKLGPGVGLGPFGQWFTRKETWAEQAGGWVDYLARSCYLLQQGRFVADIAYLYGEDTNVTSLFNNSAPPIPPGFNFDFINTDVLLNELTVKHGQLVTRSGMAYRVLALDASTKRLSLPALRKLRELVYAGATVVGTRPVQTPSLADDEGEFRALVAELWSETAGQHSVGSGRVFDGIPLAEALRTLEIAPDVSFAQSSPELRFVHRALEEGELYFVSNGEAQRQTVEASFRVNGKVPELWRADNGSRTAVSYRTENGRIVVPLQLEANDAVFIVFRQPATAPSAIVPAPTVQTLTRLEGPWELNFPPNLGAPAQARFDQLYSWTESTDAGVKYFSGTATYNKTLKIHRQWLRDRSRIQIDLGAVKNVAEVLVNGRSLGVLWKAPYRLDITAALQAGDNRLEIKVTNLWPNRLIGDKQPGAQKIAFATLDPFKADSPLLPSGLLGPVTLLRISP